MKTDTEKLALLLSILRDYSDTVDGADGEPGPNMAMGILCDYEMRLHYAVGNLDWALRQGDVLADWCNVSGAALAALMDAYERRVRSLCTPEQIKAEPWRCGEFIAAERALASKPVAQVVLSGKETLDGREIHPD